MLAVLMTGMRLAASQSADSRDSEIELFISKFVTYRQKNANYLKPYDEQLSPWIPYLKQPFDKGLSGEFLSDYNYYQEVGECYAIRKLELVGFIALNPQLAEVFQDRNVFFEFDISVASDLGRGTLRCSALSQIVKKKALSAKKENAAGEKNRINSDFIPNREPSRDNPIHQLMILAICADYAPAIVDMLEYDGNYADFLKPPERAYLWTRAFHKKIPLFDAQETVILARNSVPRNMRLELDAVGYMADPRKLENLLPSWQVWCAKTQFWRFREEFVNSLMGTKDSR
ncbi:MAG: hypothetical protein L3J32_12795 [Rhizobiaceae bacterium]|nr:hypothetical protein [Rhizobiaceae bacterium]